MRRLAVAAGLAAIAGASLYVLLTLHAQHELERPWGPWIEGDDGIQPADPRVVDIVAEHLEATRS